MKFRLDKKFNNWLIVILGSSLVIFGLLFYFNNSHYSKEENLKSRNQAEVRVSQAETLRTEFEINKAKKSIKHLSKNDQKPLKNRLKHLIKQMDLLDEAAGMVNVAEQTRTKGSRDGAISIVNQLDKKILSKDKEILTERLNKINIIDKLKLGS